MEIPTFNTEGNLPPGIHWTTYKQFTGRFGFNTHRLGLIDGMQTLINMLSNAGCKYFFVDGSFTTSKEFPSDYDACWETAFVDGSKIDPVLLRFDVASRMIQKTRYKGDVFPAHLVESESGLKFLKFFQVDKFSGEDKGIIAFEI